jgi:hypothetical protein
MEGKTVMVQNGAKFNKTLKRWELPPGSNPTARMGVQGEDGQPSIPPLGQKAAALLKEANKPFSEMVMDPETGEMVKVSAKNKDEYPSAVVRTFESRIRSDSVETGIIVDGDGKIVLKKKGTEDQVSFTSSEVALMTGRVLTHNHPHEPGYDTIGIGLSLSMPDLKSLNYAKAKEMRAVTKEGSVFSMRLNKPDSIPEHTGKRDGYFTRMWGNAKKNAIPRLQRMVDEGHITASEYRGEAGLHLMNRYFASRSKGVFSYSATFENSAGADRIKALEKIFDETK